MECAGRQLLQYRPFDRIPAYAIMRRNPDNGDLVHQALPPASRM